MSELLDEEAIRELLRQLGARLAARGLQAEIYVVGGTAMVLAYDRSRLTRDIDAVTDMQDAVELEAREMARGRRGLSPDWFNGKVRPMLPRVFDEEQTEALSVPGLSVSVASPRHMLAMKVRATRGARDLDDVLLLCARLGIGSISAVFDIADDVWGPGMLRPESIFFVTEALAAKGFTP